MKAEPCIGKDPRCPCQDGDACHYKDCGGTKALPVPVAQPEQKPPCPTCEALARTVMLDQTSHDTRIKRINDAVLAEREACAKVCEEYFGYGTRAEFAATIRARGQE